MLHLVVAILPLVVAILVSPMGVDDTCSGSSNTCIAYGVNDTCSGSSDTCIAYGSSNISTNFKKPYSVLLNCTSNLTINFPQ